MKKIYVFLLFNLFGLQCYAQWQKQIGVNLLPISVKSFEITSEFSNNSRLAFTANAGYVHRTGYEGISNDDVYDGVSNRQTSGLSLKAGTRFYTLKAARGDDGIRRRKFNLFFGASLIGSWYHKKADYVDLTTNADPPYLYHTDKTGFLWGPALIGGLTFRPGSRLHLDTGIQYGYMVNGKGKNIGRGSFNYQPGFGSSNSAFMLMAAPPLAITATHSQAIVTPKYRL